MTEHVSAEALAGADPGRRAEILEHLRTCSRCREAAFGADPAQVFSLLGNSPVPGEVLDRLSLGVARAIRSGARPGFRRIGWRGRLAAAWGAAAAVAVACLLALGGPTERIAARAAASQAHYAGSGAERATAVPAAVEVLVPPGSPEVVDLLVGDTQVVMIFDERLDL